MPGFGTTRRFAPAATGRVTVLAAIGVVVAGVAVGGCSGGSRSATGDTAAGAPSVVDSMHDGAQDSTRDVTSDATRDVTRDSVIAPPARSAGPPARGASPPAAGGAPLSIPLPDTARGIVQRVGSEPQTILVLSLARGQEALTPTGILALAGTELPLLGAVVGLEVMVSGRQTSDLDVRAHPRGAPIFRVEAFRVRALDGVVAHDGILRNTTEGFALEQPDRTLVHLTNPPPALTRYDNQRVFVVGPTTRAPQAWGVVK